MKLDAQRTVGEVIEVNNKTAVVAFGAMLTSVKLNRLTKVSKAQAKKESTTYNQTSALVQEKISKRKLTFRRDIDVRGMRAEEALQVVMDHVDEVDYARYLAEFRILHGTGHGILRIR